jgi:hypothetical protein
VQNQPLAVITPKGRVAISGIQDDPRPPFQARRALAQYLSENPGVRFSQNASRRNEEIKMELSIGFSAKPQESGASLTDRAERIWCLRKSVSTHAIEATIQIGGELFAAKKEHGHDQFGTWLENEFGWTSRTGENFINAYKAFGSNPKRVSDLNIPLKALYAIAAPSTLKAARDKAIAHAQGKKLTRIAEAIENECHSLCLEAENLHGLPKAAHVGAIGDIARNLGNAQQRLETQMRMLRNVTNELRDFVR